MATKEPELLCIGNALVDVFASLDREAVIRHGITRPVQHVETEKAKAILSDIGKFTAVSGGGAANVAKIAGFLGAKVCFTGAIGSGEEGKTRGDNFGRLFKKDLSACGVKLRLSLKPFPTGLCLLLRAENGKTHIAASPSAALNLSENDINEEDIQKARVVVIDGFMLDRPGLVDYILRLADRHGTVAAIDLSAVSIAGRHAKEIVDYLRRYSLILFMNESEASAFYKAAALYEGLGEGESGFQSFFQSLTEEEFPVIAVKLGEQGAMCFAGGAVYRNGTKALIPLETTGAGDAFCAAFLTAWVRNKSISECADRGNKAAALFLDAEGTRLDGKRLKDFAGKRKKQRPQ